MELLERNTFLADLENCFNKVESGTGHSMFIMGEAGIGKSSLLNTFLKTLHGRSINYVGACDSLFTPRPLGPLYDIAGQIDEAFESVLNSEQDRSKIFGTLFNKLSQSRKPIVLAIEDVHWTDDATLDFIKFLARRINRVKCLFLATYRDDEVHSRHPLSSIFGELPGGHYTKMTLTRLSKHALDNLAESAKWLSGEQLYKLTSGNPFYVTEILSTGGRMNVPERVKDSIMARFNTRSDGTKALWEFLSIMASPKVEPKVEQEIEREFGSYMDECIASGIIISKPGYLSFNHELFRMTIEESLTPIKRKLLHKKMLDLLQSGEKESKALIQIVHHARLADEKELVAALAPKAAAAAEAVSAHREAAKLYSAAIDYTQAQGEELAILYEKHAYNCYLTYNHPTAIGSQQRALGIWRDLKLPIKEGSALRFLSRLWWMVGDHKQAIQFGDAAIKMLSAISPTPLAELGMAYSNGSQIAMLGLDMDKALALGNKAIDIATRINDNTTLAHALNNVGAALMANPETFNQGEEKLEKSLSLALQYKMHEHVARAYVNLSFNFLIARHYQKSIHVCDQGIKYCTEHDVDVLRYYVMAAKATALLEVGRWDEAETIADQLTAINPNFLVKIVIHNMMARLAMRKGEFDYAHELLDQIMEAAFQTNEMQRVCPVITGYLELYWLKGEPLPADKVSRFAEKLSMTRNNYWYYSDFCFWNRVTQFNIDYTTDLKIISPFQFEQAGHWKRAADEWGALGCNYEKAITLLNGDEEHQKSGVKILDELGATATSNRFREILKEKGVKNIPRGPRESTLKNPAQLTERQVDILKLLKEGLPNKEIAERLFISPKTVDHHISAILNKLNVSSRAKAVVEGERLRIL